MTNGVNPKKFDIYDRCFIFASKTAQILLRMPRNPFIDEYVKQLIRSSGSIGANLTEADGAISKKDFINKLCIARKEAKESIHWLKLIHSISSVNGNLLNGLIQENTEIMLILSKIIQNTQNNSKQ